MTELDSARFDVLLVRSVAKSAVTALEGLTSRVNNLVRINVYLSKTYNQRSELGALGIERSYGDVAHWTKRHAPANVECSTRERFPWVLEEAD